VKRHKKAKSKKERERSGCERLAMLRRKSAAEPDELVERFSRRSLLADDAGRLSRRPS
jgi:hypothetical protein